MKKILVIGDFCVDTFIYGKTERLSPEAPVPVFVPTETKINDGMAGNVATNLTAMSTEYHVELYHQDEVIKKTRYIDQNTYHMFLNLSITLSINLLEVVVFLATNPYQPCGIKVEMYSLGSVNIASK